VHWLRFLSILKILFIMANNKNILIANRGEIAIRIARTCRKLGLHPYGIYSDSDKDSLHIKYCEESLNIGGTVPQESYLVNDKIIDAAIKLRCDYIHPGYGFLSENPKFVKLCNSMNLVFIGPPYDAMTISGDKVRARKVASKVAPVVDGVEVFNEADVIKEAERIGYPVMLKAVEGGGGRGLRIVNSYEDLDKAYLSSKNETMVGFGSERVYVEKYIENPRHIEVQIIADEIDIVHLGERECSIQRRHQKLIEETPSPALSTEKRNEITQTAVEIMREIEYKGAGTVEFLFKDNRFYFMEVNARIQVEHPITELVTGVDIVEQQLQVALGRRLTVNQQNMNPKGHAIECRINAEHPLSFVPSPGVIKNFSVPTGNGIRVDTALYSGYSIPIVFDSLIAKLICWGNNRYEAIQKMKDSLLSFRISGIPSTIPFHMSALNDPRFIDGAYDTSFVNKLKSFSVRDGDVAAAVFSLLPKHIEFLKGKGEELNDPWMSSRFDWLDAFDIHHNPNRLVTG
jgi:acetyl-CoA carboxylase biotin carboxylase subunit